MNDDRAVIGRGFGFGLLGADAHHRGVDHGVLDAVDEQNRHPQQREPSKFLDPKIAGQQDAGEEVDATRHRLVGKRPINVAVAPHQRRGGSDHDLQAGKI